MSHLSPKSIPFTQRSDDGVRFVQVDISGSNLIIQTDVDGHLIGLPFSAPEVFPVLGSGGTTSLNTWSANVSFTFPTPVIPTGRTIYSGMRITFSDTVTGDYTVGSTANPLGNYELPLIHGWGISGATPDPFYFYTRNNLTGPVDPAGTSFTTTVSMSGSVIIPAQQFTPDGIASLTFFDDSEGLGFMTPTIQNGGSFGINMTTSLLLPGIYILAEYIYA